MQNPTLQPETGAPQKVVSFTTPVRALYICYFGLREPLVQSQVLPYLRELRAAGADIRLLTFEADPKQSWTPEAEAEWREKLRSEGISWRWRTYHKRPSLPATLYDIAIGGWTAAAWSRSERADIVHCRAHVAAAMGAICKRLTGARLLFDIRGFNAEEYVDAGNWEANGLKFRLTKKAERKLLAKADGFVVLTERARDILWPGSRETNGQENPIEVIPCCVDIARFAEANAETRSRMRRELGLEGRRVLVYVGGLGGWYLTEEMADFIATAHRQDPATFTMILTQSPTEPLTERLEKAGVAASDLLLRKVSPADIPRYLSACDVALSFIKPCFSKQASSPTKLAEYLACGLPVVCNTGIGDVDAVLQEDKVGVLLNELSLDAYRQALEAADVLRQDAGLAERCRASARDRFALDSVGGPRYRRLYARLMGKEARR